MQSFPRGLLIFSVILSLIVILIWPRWTVDDAFISYRYGKNWVETGELTWNPGESPKVEGYTGIVLPALAALSIKMGLKPEEAARWVGVLSFFLAVFCFWRIGKMHFGSEWIAALMVLGWISYPFLYTHAHSGLETMLFLGFLLFTVERLGNFLIKFTYSAAVWLGFTLLVLCLVRPEGVLLAFSMLLVLVFKAKIFSKSGAWPQIGLASAVFVLPAAAYFLWRFQYYEAWLPNTFYAKSYAGWVNPEAVMAWARFILKFMVLPGLAVLFWSGGLRKMLGSREALPLNPNIGLLGWVVASFIIFYLMFYLKINLYMNYEYRFFLPVLAMGWLGLGILMSRRMEIFKMLSNKYLIVISSTITLLFFAVVGLKVPDNLFFTHYYKSIMEEEWKPAAAILESANLANKKVAVFMDAGAIGYFSGCKILDMGRLNDRYLARQNPAAKAVADYFFDWDADACVFTSADSSKYTYIGEAEMIVQDPRFSKYTLTRIFGNSADFPYFQFLYMRVDKATVSVY